MTALLVALGAAVGAPLRWLVGRLVPGPRGTLVVNVLGSALLGASLGLGPSSYALVGTGFCGALTTFSTFAVEAVETRSWRYVLATGVLCVAAASLARAAV